MKKILAFLLLLALFALGGLYFFNNHILTKQGAVPANLYNFIPKNAAYIAEINQPIDKWQQFGNSKIWQFLSKNEYLNGINQAVENLAQTLKGKEDWIQYFVNGKMLVSAHIAPPKYDYLYVVDIQTSANIDKLNPILPTIFKTAGYTVTQTDLQNGAQTIFNLYDPAAKSTLYLTFKNNALIASYSQPLVADALQTYTQQTPHFATNELFLQTKDNTPKAGINNLYVNYNELPDFLKYYTQTPATEPFISLSKMLSFSGLNAQLTNDALTLTGVSKINPTDSASYLKALLHVGSEKSTCANAFPSNTSFYNSFIFKDFKEFRTVALQLKNGNQTPNSKNKLANTVTEKVLTELEKWIGNEIAIGMVPLADNSAAQAYLTVIPINANNQEATQERLHDILEITNSLNPFNIFKRKDKNNYRNYQIIYLPAPGLLKLLAGNILSNMQRPALVLLDGFLVFCDNETVLKKTIDDFLDGRSLGTQKNYQDFMQKFDTKANVFCYAQTQHLYPFLLSKTKGTQQQSIQKNKDYILSFEQIGVQLTPKSNDMYNTYLNAHFVPITAEPTTAQEP